MLTYQNNAAIWKNKTKKGDTYLTFKAEKNIKAGEKFNFFANKRKTEDKHPDFTSSERIEDEQVTDKPISELIEDINF